MPSELQTLQIAEEVGAETTVGSVAFEACGSPGEVANNPLKGNMYLFNLDTFTGAPGGSIKNNELDIYYHFNQVNGTNNTRII